MMTNPLQFAPVPRRDREATERRVVRAALEILERNSALYGFRLRDVAEHPEISRGNFFCYFGNRRELLRRTLHVRFTEMAEPKETQPSEPLDNHSLT
jgi:AcrR family transcriptional regulator